MPVIIVVLTLLSPMLIVYKHNQQAEYMLSSRAKNLNINEKIGKEIWRDRGILYSNIAIVLGANFSIIGLFIYSKTTPLSYALIGIGCLLAGFGILKKIIALQTLYKRCLEELQ